MWDVNGFNKFGTKKDDSFLFIHISNLNLTPDKNMQPNMLTWNIGMSWRFECCNPQHI